MTDNIKLPPMPKPHTPPVFATAANTPSVKAGYELGGYEKTPPLFDEHQLEAYAREAVRLNAIVPDGLKEKLTDLFADGLRGTWHCNRVWEAWHVGTMSEDDFEPVEESDTPAELADAVIAMLSAAPAAPQPAQPLDLIVMELAESVGLIGPASRTDDLHEAIQRFHDLIVVNASIKAALHFADGLAQQPLADEKDALLRQALDALENSETTVPYVGFGTLHRQAIRAHLAITEAIRNHLGVKND